MSWLPLAAAGVGDRRWDGLTRAGFLPRNGEELRRLPWAGDVGRCTAAATAAAAEADSALFSQTSLHRWVRSWAVW